MLTTGLAMAINHARQAAVRYDAVLKQLNNTFKDNNDALNKLSNLREYAQLPFPSILLMPARFNEERGEDFHFMGREIFCLLVKAVEELENGISYNEWY